MFIVNSLWIFSLFLCAVSSPNGENSGEEKVSFGDEPIEDYPSLVSLIMYYKSKNETEQMFGGTLITAELDDGWNNGSSLFPPV
ncbi:unnamed protein product [Allacma fusca]|uniref:Uncharacterized protein n=1 Tax=Allacma fusca TaxID=39272 RepID=A0A8J2NM18_9HEXA|nr:unnamed protein product [Allacma fusca]